jgi:hypothetical protein
MTDRTTDLGFLACTPQCGEWIWFLAPLRPLPDGEEGWTVREAGLTHEQFVHDVRAAAVAWATDRGTITEAEAGRTLAAKLVYGAGDGRYRGVCHYSAWANGVSPVEVVEIAAAGKESLVQVAGTTLHELGHRAGRLGSGPRRGVEARPRREAGQVPALPGSCGGGPDDHRTLRPA